MKNHFDFKNIMTFGLFLHVRTLTTIYLPGQPGDVLPPVPSLAEGVMFMSTYEELMVIIATAGLIVSILNMKNKK